MRSATGKMPANPVLAVLLSRSLRPTTATTGVGAARSATAAGSFPLQRLVVEASFAGDDQVGVTDVAIEVEQVKEVVRAGGGAGTQEHGGVTDAAGGT